MAISTWFGGEEKELLPKDVLVELESNPNRVDEMLEKMVKADKNSMSDFGGMNFVTATAMAFPGPSDLERAMRQLEQQQMTAMQQNLNQQFQGGLGNGFSNQGLGNALGGFGGLLGPRR